MNEELESFRKKASKQSLGLSSDNIVSTIIEYINQSKEITPNHILDVGCGTGNLLHLISKKFKMAKLTGCDYTEFSSWTNDEMIDFFQHDCNSDLPHDLEKFDLIVSSEVIEHIENGRHFVRQLSNKLSSGGFLIISTPNIESITSLLSFFFRGYHSAFGEKDYPAHILPIASYDLVNMVRETNQLEVKDIIFINNGRIPKLDLKWNKYIPFLKGKRFSDNYFIVAKKK